MSLIYTTPDPGDWYSWRKKDANKDLNPEEAKRKFLKEQLEFQDQMAYHNANIAMYQWNKPGSHAGGDNYNSISTVVLSSPFELIGGSGAGFSVFIAATASFIDPVNVSRPGGGGDPSLQVATNFAGGGVTVNGELEGRSSPFTIDFNGLSDDGREMYFENTYIIGQSNQNINIMANTLLSGSVDFGNATAGSATGLTGGSSGLLVLTYSGSHGTPASKTGVNVSASYLVNGGGTDFVNMIVATEQSSSVIYNAGDVFSLNTATQGLGGTGTLTWTVGAEDITGDTISIPASEISLGTAVITNDIGEGVPNLTYAAQGTPLVYLAASSSLYTD